MDADQDIPCEVLTGGKTFSLLERPAVPPQPGAKYCIIMDMDMKELFDWLARNDPAIASAMRMGKVAKVQAVNDEGEVVAEFEVDALEAAKVIMENMTFEDVGESLFDLLSKAGYLPMIVPEVKR